MMQLIDEKCAAEFVFCLITQITVHADSMCSLQAFILCLLWEECIPLIIFIAVIVLVCCLLVNKSQKSVQDVFVPIQVIKVFCFVCLLR